MVNHIDGEAYVIDIGSFWLIALGNLQKISYFLMISDA